MRKIIDKISAKKLLLTLLGIFVIIIFYKFFTLLSFPDSSIVLTKGGPIKMLPKEIVSQKFTTNRNGFHTLDFLLRSPGIKPGDNVTVEIRDENCGKVLRKGNLEIPFLNSNNLYVFNFNPIANSNGKNFCATATFEPGKGGAKNVLMFVNIDQPNGPFASNLITGQTYENQTLSIRPEYRNANVWQDLRELNQRMSQYKPWFLKGFFLETVIVLFVILSISLAVFLTLL